MVETRPFIVKIRAHPAFQHGEWRSALGDKQNHCAAISVAFFKHMGKAAERLGLAEEAVGFDPGRKPVGQPAR